MASWDDVRRISWRVREKLFVWERPLRRADLEELIVEAWLTRAPKRVAKEYIEAKLPAPEA